MEIKEEGKGGVLSAVRHEATIICQVERVLPGQRLANQTCNFELHLLSYGWPMEFA